MTLHRTQFNRKRNTDAPPSGYSSLPGGLSNQKPQMMSKQMNRLRHMHARQAVSGQNPENAKTAHTSQRIHAITIIQGTTWCILLIARENNSHYLDFLLFTRILDVFTNPNLPRVFSCTLTLSSTLNSLHCSCLTTKTPLPSSLSVSSSLSLSLSLSQLYPF